ncbi:UDP-N-acetylmuramoyl-tripeptide--D-alanyl-D-alanine ligase [Litchfieldia salsa]|uniref:UDP-N-acetylmuramoyl-tripeptide--D-alanyl-D-alanine ligase n=1 Tax=Litchfieldia salsa TaxID=930152 RepID=A0A1H0WY71_9BACI|nr:UDP-N-acetylmuramoyl-tripeptide--D-alanyl-D-alanine ligase [Litchfieldia salsa]SDP95385.1 UDP-N-acetylmuramoyl-tripeptide--D-alanyl-D-alanine ligase [Litchfieldia salsa]
MINRILIEVKKMVDGSCLEQFNEVEITGVSIDTRTVREGNLFIPIIGEKFNGHEFVETAIKNGAVASFWQEDQPNPPQTIPLIYVKDTLIALQTLSKSYLGSLAVKVVGITGSNGKTTTKDMVQAVLSTKYKVQKTEGNLNNHIGLPLTILRLEKDTEIAVLEMGMSGKGEIELLSTIAEPDAAIITNIGESHLLDLGSREAISDAKLEITRGLNQDGPLIYHGEEPLLNSRVEKMPYRKITFGQSTSCDYYSSSLQQENEGTYFQVNEKEQPAYFIPVLGKHNVNNALAAIAIAEYLNVPSTKIADGLKKLKITGMRTELVKGQNGVSIINDAYNASPTSMKAAIELLQDMKGFRQKIVVLGDMLELGENERSFHYEIGKIIQSDEIDYVFTYGELASHISLGAKETFEEGKVFPYQDKENLINHLKQLVGENDLVLVKGSRGMKLEEVVEGL